MYSKQNAKTLPLPLTFEYMTIVLLTKPLKIEPQKNPYYSFLPFFLMALLPEIKFSGRQRIGKNPCLCQAFPSRRQNRIRGTPLKRP
jgi:hypothetical protein